METMIEILKKPKLKDPVAVVGSQGLRSIGLIAIDHMIMEWNLKQFATLHSSHFPIVYHGLPYEGVSGEAGSAVKDGVVNVPKIEFYEKSNVIITRGYHADGEGQYEVAVKVADFFKDMGVKRIISLGGFVHNKFNLDEERRVSICGTNEKIIEEVAKKGVSVDYTGPFLGFSALVLGAGMSRGIEGFALFSQTTPDQENPLNPDPVAAKALLKKLSSILETEIDTKDMEMYDERILLQVDTQKPPKKEKKRDYVGYI